MGALGREERRNGKGRKGGMFQGRGEICVVGCNGSNRRGRAGVFAVVGRERGCCTINQAAFFFLVCKEINGSEITEPLPVAADVKGSGNWAAEKEKYI